jgi:hypothetical protein
MLGSAPWKTPLRLKGGFPPTLATLGISYDQLHRYQTIASLPAPDFETHLARTQAWPGGIRP